MTTERLSRVRELLRAVNPTVDSPTYRLLARTAPESERSETRPTPGTIPQFRSRPVVPHHPDEDPGWSLPATVFAGIECSDGDVFPTVAEMYDHIRLVHLGIDVPDPDDALTEAYEGLEEAVRAYFDPENQYTDSRLRSVERALATLTDLRCLAAPPHMDPAPSEDDPTVTDEPVEED